MKKALALIQIIGLLFWNVPFFSVIVARADDSDIFGTNIQPNVMILFDQSGSMAEEIFDHPYNPSNNYTTPLTYNTTKVYRQFTSKKSCKPDDDPCYKVYADSISDVSSSSARTALQSTGYWSGKISGSNVDLFVGNYLNWQACVSCSATESKIHVAQTVVANILSSVEGVRFGVMKFQNSNSPYGASMVAPIGSSTSTMVDAVNNLTPSGGTPTGEALRDVGRYFSGNFSSYASPIQYSCQPNFVIIISDGMSNYDQGISGAVNPRTQATTEFTTDHSSFGGMQNLVVDTVGFNLPAGDPGIVSLQETAKNGGGTYYSASNYAQLEAALQAAIRQIIAATFAFANPVIPTTNGTSNNRAYLASFQSDPLSPFWRGFLKAYQRDADGLITVDAQHQATGFIWDAGTMLSQKAPSARTIYTVVSGARQDFTTGNGAITPALLAAADSTEKNKIINFIRGTDAYDADADGDTTEERPWKLGDIFHSTPAVVGPPRALSNDASYNTFKTANASRTTILLAGANDGMLHAFRESDGAELWGFIPPDLLDNLKSLTGLTGPHEFFVDSSPIPADVKIGATWKTVVIFGERRGGKNYYALDITDTSNPLYLWGFTDAKMGETWSEPVIGKIKMSDGTDKYVAFVGGGYDTLQNNNSGKAFFVIDIATGAKLWEYYKPASSSDDRQYMSFSIAAPPSALDLNNDGYIDRVYIGDVGGQLWKFDLSKPASLSGSVVTTCATESSSNCWMGKRLFAATPSQPNPPPVGEYYPAQAIYVAPVVTYDNAGALWIYFGTGDRNHPNNTAGNRFYGFKDNTTMANGSALTESSLTNVTSGSGSITQGYYVGLNANEKVLAGSEVFNYVVYFTTFTPVSTVACGSNGGNAKLYALNLTSGDAAVDLTSGVALSAGQSALAAGRAIGSGIPSRPIVNIVPNGNRATPHITTGTTSKEIFDSQGPGNPLRRIAAWREVF